MEERRSYTNLESLPGRDRHAHDFQDSDILEDRGRGHPDLHEYNLNRKGFEVPRERDGERSRSWVRASYDRESQQAQMIAFRVVNRRRSRLRIFCASFVVLVFSFLAPVSGQADAAAQKEGIKLTQQLGPLNQVCTGFSENVAGPIKKMLPYNIFYSQGWAGSPRAFFNAFLTGPAEQAFSCDGGAVDGTSCSYASFITLMVVAFAAIMPISVTIYCMGFCCARTFTEKCYCCCALCKQPNCGSKKPTADYDTKEKVCISLCVVFMMLLFPAISVLGFLSTLQVTTDVNEISTSMAVAAGFPAEWNNQLNASFSRIDENSNRFLLRANDFTADGPKVMSSAEAMNNSLKTLITKWKEIAEIIEGKATNGRSNPCTYYYNGTTSEHRAKYDGNLGVWWYNLTRAPKALWGISCCEVVDHGNCIRGHHPQGVGAILFPSSRKSPTCLQLGRDNVNGYTVTEAQKTCPCCCTCQKNIESLEGVVGLLPKPEEFTKVTPVLAKELMSATILGLGKYLKKSIDTFNDYIAQLKKGLDPVSSALGNDSLVLGTSGTFWIFASMGPIMAFSAWLFVNITCWWVGYVCGYLTLLLVSILFGVSSAIVIPFGDICEGLPITGRDPTPWLVTFSPEMQIASVKPELVRLHSDCLVLTNLKNPSLWNVAGLSKGQVVNFFSAFNVSKSVPVAISDPILDLQARTLAFTKIKKTVEALDGNSFDFWGGSKGLQEEKDLKDEVMNSGLQGALTYISGYDEYRTTISEAVLGMQMDLADVIDKQTKLLKITTELQTNLSLMRIETEKSLGALGDEIIGVSNCSHLNKIYMDLRNPTCEKLAKSVDAMWALFFICGFFCLPLFFVICRGSKHTQARRGIAKVDPNQGGENGAKKDKFDKIDAVDKDKEKEKDKKDKDKKEKKKKPKKEGAPKASEESMARKSAAK